MYLHTDGVKVRIKKQMGKTIPSANMCMFLCSSNNVERKNNSATTVLPYLVKTAAVI